MWLAVVVLPLLCQFVAVVALLAVFFLLVLLLLWLPRPSQEIGKQQTGFKWRAKLL